MNLLAQRPEWRVELRRLVLSDELLALPSTVEQLVQAVTELRRSIDALVEAQARSDERRDVLLSDLVVRGRGWDEGQEQYLVAEVSVGIGLSDVERAARRAALLGRLRPALPVVAGERLLFEAAEAATRGGVWCFLGARAIAPDE